MSGNGMYVFNPNDAIRFAEEQRRQGNRYQILGDELNLKECPYCKNSYSKDRKKFFISLKTGQFQCFRASCGAKGNMLTLHKDFGFSLGKEADSYFDRDFRSFRQIHMKKPESKDSAIRYLKSRGISEKVTREYGITVQREHENVLVFPFMDENGIIQFVKYRKTDFEKGKDSSKEWCEKNCMPILFGMYQCNPENKTLILTEGQIDSLSVIEAGVENAVSVPTGANGFTWVPYCWDWLQKFETLIVFGDHEKGHITLLDEMKSRFRGCVKVVRTEDYKDCKDANELLQKHGPDAVRKAVEQAEAIKAVGIKYAKTIKRVDISELEKISSGIPKLDRLLGGFFFGQTILISGERGKGKSTLASQFATKAISQGYNVFFYSGELMDWYWKAWIDYQVAGSNFINTKETDFGKTYSIDASIIPAMEEWYGDKLLVYDNSVVYEDEHEDLLETVKKAIIQYDCRVIFLDNLMTAIEDDGKTDLYRQQSNWVKKLVSIGKDFNVLIFLIAHPRKGNGLEFNNDSVAGSSNITNLVDAVINYDSPKEEMEYPRELKVTKNRLTGRVTKKDNAIPLYFEESSKRISENGNFNWTLGWEPSDKYGFVHPTNVDIELPFD